MPGVEVGLIASIDREAVRFALTPLQGSWQPIRQQSVPIARYTTFTAAVEAYLRDALPRGWPRRVAIALAGVPLGDTVSVTGGSWHLSLVGLEAYLRTRPLLLNDFAASVFAISHLAQGGLRSVRGEALHRDGVRGTIALIGPLQGLGTAGLIHLGSGRAAVIQSEAGNSSLAMMTEDEQRFVQTRQISGRFVPEHLLSEPGLVRAFDMIAGRGAETDPGRSAQRIALQAGAGERDARRAVDLFTGALAEYARSVVMTLGSWQGLYLSGPLVRLLERDIASEKFLARFEGSDKYRRRLASVPIAIVMEDNLDMRGAAVALRSEEAFDITA